MPKQLLRKAYQSALTQTDREYFLFLPEGYEDDPERQWPLLLFLHGMGERGNDVDKVLVHGPIKEALLDDRDLPFVILGPQCPKEDSLPEGMAALQAIDEGKALTWDHCADEVMALVDTTISECRIDLARVYLTGLSMGGFGSWLLAAQHAGRWAAVGPICGGGEPAEAPKIGKTPVWTFHGGQDKTVPPERTKEMVEALRAAGGNVKYTHYPDLAHNSWDRVYEGDDFYDWLLKNEQ